MDFIFPFVYFFFPFFFSFLHTTAFPFSIIRSDFQNVFETHAEHRARAGRNSNATHQFVFLLKERYSR